MSRSAAAAALLGAAALAGCGGSSPSSRSGPRATVQRYFAAVSAKRAEAACSELTEQSRQRLAELAQTLHARGNDCPAVMRVVLTSAYGTRLGRFAKPKITALRVTGTTATASVDGLDSPLKLIDQDGTWRIDFAPAPPD
jgi:hypothetical protein